MQNNDMVDVTVTEDKNHMEICDNCIHRSYCFVAGKKKEYCGNYTEERWWNDDTYRYGTRTDFTSGNRP